jgi:hypothetical protein
VYPSIQSDGEQHMSILSAIITGSQLGQSIGLLDPLNRVGGKLSNLIHPNAMPSAMDAVAAWRAGKLNSNGMAMACFGAGIFPPKGTYNFDAMRALHPTLTLPVIGESEVWDAVHRNQATRPNVEMIFSLRAKGLIDAEEQAKLLSEAGAFDPRWTAHIFRQWQSQMPQPGELVSFALRESWDQATVNRFQYDAEFPPEFKAFMGMIGCDGVANPTPDQPAGPNTPTWSQIYWRAHWRNLSPTEAFEMFQRLRPGRVERYQDALPGLRAFTLDDLRQVLKINDFPVPFREQLAAIAYRKPRLVDIDRFYRNDAIDRREVYELHLDLGYSPADAELRTEWLEREKQRNPTNAARKRLPKRLIQLYSLGRIERPQLLDDLTRVLSDGHFTNYANLSEVGEGRREAERVQRDVDLLVMESDIERETGSSQKLLRAFRRQYLHGQINERNLADHMINAGFSQAFIGQFLRELDTELASGRLLLSTERIRRLTIQGIMPLPDAVQHLENLGWKQPEIGYLTAQLKRDLEMEAEQAVERMTSDALRQESSRLRQAALLARKRNEAIKRLNKQATPAQLRKYFVRAIISEREYERELQRRGFEDATIKTILRDAGIDRTAYASKRRARAASIDAGRINAPGGNAAGGNAATQNGQRTAPPR